MTNNDTRAAVGVAAAACAACCAGPILGVLAAIGLTTAAGITLFGFLGLATAALAIPVIVRRRRRTARCKSPAQTVTIRRSRTPAAADSP